MDARLLEILVCPVCKGPLDFVKDKQELVCKADRLAFLVNAYNAHTIALVLTRYPDLASIKDLGGWITSPWKQKFFELLGESRSLDDVEHRMIRGGVGAREPRVHFALNCASIGCPALRPEAYRGASVLVRKIATGMPDCTTSVSSFSSS